MEKKTIETNQKDMATKVNLSVADRINFPSIMIPRGSLSEMALSESLIKRIEISESEKKEFGMIALPDGRLAWEVKKAKLREFCFENFELLLIQQGIRMHDESKTLLPENHNLARRLLAIVVKEKEKQ